jgi:hypothetical protein
VKKKGDGLVGLGWVMVWLCLVRLAWVSRLGVAREEWGGVFRHEGEVK